MMDDTGYVIRSINDQEPWNVAVWSRFYSVTSIMMRNVCACSEPCAVQACSVICSHSSRALIPLSPLMLRWRAQTVGDEMAILLLVRRYLRLKTAVRQLQEGGAGTQSTPMTRTKLGSHPATLYHRKCIDFSVHWSPLVGAYAPKTKCKSSGSECLCSHW
jgi:hypothetical protein